MKRSVAIARALAAQPEAILYDEPTTMVDPLTAHLLGDLIKKLKYQLKLTSIVVTHDMALAKKIADRIVFLHEGQVVFLGTPAEMETSQVEIVREFLTLDSLDLDYWRSGQNPPAPLLRNETSRFQEKKARLLPSLLTGENLAPDSLHEPPGTAQKPFATSASALRPSWRSRSIHFSRYLATMSVSMLTGSPGLRRAEIRTLDGVRNDGDRAAQAFEFGHRQADAFDRNRALEDQIAARVRQGPGRAARSRRSRRWARRLRGVPRHRRDPARCVRRGVRALPGEVRD